MSQQTINGYEVRHQRGVITVTKNGNTLKFMPAEADQIREIVNIALSMESLPALPPQINNGRFEVQFNENDTLGISGVDGIEGSVTFTWNEGDEFILTIDEAQKIALNEIKLGYR